MKGLIITGQDVRMGAYDNSTNELINASLERLIFCETNAMVGSLDNGSRVLDYFYDKADSSTALAIMDEIKNLIKYNEPRIVLDAIGVNIVPSEGAAGLIIILKYHSIENPNKSEYVKFIKIRTLTS